MRGMTSEEIEKAMEELHLDSICRDGFDSEDLATVRTDIAEAMRALVSRAYEEAAQINEERSKRWGQEQHTVGRELLGSAKDIRALKDSLVREGAEV